MTADNDVYWHNACHFFHRSGFASSKGSYLVHNKNRKTVSVGVQCQKMVLIESTSILTVEGTDSMVTSPLSGGPVLSQIDQLLEFDTPWFFLLSLDLNRLHRDESLPMMIFVQPVVQLTFSPDRAEGEVSYASEPALGREATLLLERALQAPLPTQRAHDLKPAAFFDLFEGWRPLEEDGWFLKRLDLAVSALESFPDGKMTLTRSYEYPLTAERDPFQLYVTHARMNGEYACSHFFCYGDGIFSVGCSPENVFEVEGDRLIVDVVASTCRSSDDKQYLERELLDSAKQVKEHTSSLTTRKTRYADYCEPGSVHSVDEMQFKRLRNVTHLYSVIHGRLLPDVTLLNILEEIYPTLMGARPRELLPFSDSEVHPHRYYGGIVGHMHGNVGGCFLNLRNALLKNDVIHAKVGVGLISDSVPLDELQETKDKISGLMEAVSLWELEP